MKKTRWIKVVLAMLAGLIIGIHIYYYYQHQYTVEVTHLDTYIEFEAYDLYIMNLEIYDFEEGNLNYPDEFLSNVSASKLPTFIKRFAFRAYSFYQRPYDYYGKKSGQSRYVLNAVVLPHSSDFDEMWQNRDKVISIRLNETESGNFRTSFSGGSHHLDKSNYFTTHFSVRWAFEPADELVITDLLDGGEREVVIQLTTVPVKETYGYFKRDLTKSDVTGSNPATDLVQLYRYGNLESCKELIHKDYWSDFDWTSLAERPTFDYEATLLAYYGAFEGFDHVFKTTLRNDADKLSFLAVYDNGSWYILKVLQ